MKTIHKIILTIMLAGSTFSCQEYLDVVPDSVATIENAFTLRASAERYLFTCYSYLPRHGHFNTNPAFNAADEVWYPTPPIDVNTDILSIQRGLQNISDPYGNFWSGRRQGRPLYQGLRDCNIFLDNIHKVAELEPYERDQWINEVKFLKAYYHFYLMRMYGPIPIVKENMPISAGPEEVQVYREPVDEVTDYIVQLLDEAFASEALPNRISGTEISDLGRVTHVMVLALKAKVLVLAASPLFNGNPEYTHFRDDRGKQLISSVYDQGKWQRAANACKEAIEFAHANGYALHRFLGNTGYIINDTIRQELDIRTALTAKENNAEVIWANTLSRATDMQRWAMPLITSSTSTSGPKGILSPTTKMVELYYTENGIPISEDKDWNYGNRYTLRKATHEDRFYIKEGEQTVGLHFNREPRFYAHIGFDRGVWFGNWIENYDTTDVFYVRARKTETAARRGISNYSITGYWPKKLVNIETSAEANGSVTGSNQVPYPWPEIRLTDLYLLYSEALNEVNGYSSETTHWINLVRERAGLASIEDAWTNHATDPAKYQSKEGLREIIHRERTIELMFEGQRYWDLKRWKKAHVALNKPIKAWDITQESAPGFYSEILLANQRFQMRDYLWPIELAEIQINKNLVQNPGW